MYNNDFNYNESLEYEEITPNFHISYLPIVDNTIDKLCKGNRDELTTLILRHFKEGKCRHQESKIVEWMNGVLANRGYSKKRASALLGVERTVLSKRLRRKKDTSLADLCNFYVNACDGETEAPRLLLSQKRLNLFGYIRAINMIKQAVDSIGTTTNDTINRADINANFSEEYFILLHYYYSNIPHESVRQTKKTRLELIESVADESMNYTKGCVSNRRVHSKSDWPAVLSQWGEAWLACIALLAEADSKGSLRYACDDRPVMLHQVNNG